MWPFRAAAQKVEIVPEPMAPPLPAPEETRFSIEYYPFAHKHYPMMDGKYLKLCIWKGVIEKSKDMMYADSFYHEEEAVRFLKRAKEQFLKESVIVKKVDL